MQQRKETLSRRTLDIDSTLTLPQTGKCELELSVFPQKGAKGVGGVIQIRTIVGICNICDIVLTLFTLYHFASGYLPLLFKAKMAQQGGYVHSLSGNYWISVLIQIDEPVCGRLMWCSTGMLSLDKEDLVSNSYSPSDSSIPCRVVGRKIHIHDMNKYINKLYCSHAKTGCAVSSKGEWRNWKKSEGKGHGDPYQGNIEIRLFQCTLLGVALEGSLKTTISAECGGSWEVGSSTLSGRCSSGCTGCRFVSKPNTRGCFFSFKALYGLEPECLRD